MKFSFDRYSLEGDFRTWAPPKWNLTSEADGIGLLTVEMTAKQPPAPEPFTLEFTFPRCGAVGRWIPAADRATKYLAPDWDGSFETDLSLLQPTVCFFDGDGVQDAAVLYTATDVPNICLAVLQKDDAGAWQVQDAVEGLTDTVDTVRFARLQEGGADQIVVGYTAQQADSYLAVYAYQDGEIDDILAEPYDQYLVEDITGTGYEDLLVLDTDAQGASQIKLLTSDREGGFRQAAVMGLSADRYTGCASLAAGMGAYGGQYLVLDGWTGVSGANLASVLLRYNEQTQQMEPARQIGADALYEASLRNVPDLTSRDLDRDGVVEIPTQPEGAGLINMDQGRRMDFILWMDYTSAQPRKSFGLLDEELGFYLELPMEWYGTLMLTDGPAEDTVELRSQDGEQLYLTVRVTGLADRTSGWTRLGVVSNRLVQAQFGPDAALNDPLYRLSRSFYIL